MCSDFCSQQYLPLNTASFQINAPGAEANPKRCFQILQDIISFQWPLILHKIWRIGHRIGGNVPICKYYIWAQKSLQCNTKERSLYWQKPAHLDGQISWIPWPILVIYSNFYHRQTDRLVGRRTESNLHKSPPWNLHSWAQKGGAFIVIFMIWWISITCTA